MNFWIGVVVCFLVGLAGGGVWFAVGAVAGIVGTVLFARRKILATRAKSDA